MSDIEYYKQRVNELSRELEAAHAELGQYGADIKMLENRVEDEERLKNQALTYKDSYRSALEKIKEIVEIELVEF